MPGPDLEIGGGGEVTQTLKALVWSKNKGEGRTPPAPPGDPSLAYPFRVDHCLPNVSESRTVLDSGFQVLDSSLFQWNLDSAPVN